MPDLVAVEAPSGRSPGGREDVRPGRHPHAFANRKAQRLLVLLVDRDGLPVGIVRDSGLLPESHEPVERKLTPKKQKAQM